MHTKEEKYSQQIKQQAYALGFDFCGIAKADFLEEEARGLEAWLKAGMQGEMHYMANHFDKRLDPRLLVPGARSVITLMANYYPERDLGAQTGYKIAKYAYGEDYHFVLKRKLKDLMHFIAAEIGEVDGRVFVDSAPVMERAWARRSGLGWKGKNSLLLHKQAGSFFFLAVAIVDLPLAYDEPFVRDYCGKCTRCIDACPTEAIALPGVVDGSKCISYFTIELKDQLPPQWQGQFQDWVFGCDICQDVCPWNRFSKAHNTHEFAPSPLLPDMDKQAWEELTEETFRLLFRHSAVKRTKLDGLRRNISFAKPRQQE